MVHMVSSPKALIKGWEGTDCTETALTGRL